MAKSKSLYSMTYEQYQQAREANAFIGEIAPKLKDYESPPTESNAIELFNYWFDMAFENAQVHFDRWRQAYNFYKGLQWPKEMPSWYNMPVINHFYQITELMESYIGAHKPTVIVSPRNYEDDVESVLVSAVMEYILDRPQVDWASMTRKIIKDCVLYNCSIVHPYFSIYENYPDGEVCCDGQDLMETYPDPWARDKKKIRYVARQRYVPIDILRKEFSDYAEYFKPLSDSESAGGGQQKAWLSLHGAMTDTTDTRIKGNDKAWRDSGITGKSQVYKQDCELVKEIFVAPDVVLEYPNGFRVAWIPRTKMILGDIKPYANRTPLPFVFTFYSEPSLDMVGIAPSDNLIPMQKTTNKMMAQIINNAAAMTSGHIIVSEQSGLKKDRLTDRPGEILTVKGLCGEDYVRFYPGSQISPSLFETMSVAEQAMYNVTGMQRAMQGMREPNVSSGVAIERMQTAGDVRVQKAIANIQSGLKSIAEQLILLASSFYDTQRVAKVTDYDGNTIAVKFNRDNISGDYDIKIDIAGGLPINKSARANLMMALFDRIANVDFSNPAQVVAFRELLKQTDFPNKDKFISEILEASKIQRQNVMNTQSQQAANQKDMMDKQTEIKQGQLQVQAMQAGAKMEAMKQQTQLKSQALNQKQNVGGVQ